MLWWTVAPPQVGLSSDSTFKVTNCIGDVCGRAFLINAYCKTQMLGWVNGRVLCQLCHRLSLFVEPVFVPVLGLCLWLTKALTPITLHLSLIGSTEVVPVLGQCHCSVSAKLPLVVLDLVVCFWNDTKDNDWNRNENSMSLVFWFLDMAQIPPVGSFSPVLFIYCSFNYYYHIMFFISFIFLLDMI